MSRQPRAALISTYRLQLNCDFTFDDAAALVPYLAALGISHLYASPIFAAVPGSQHGYDVTDPGRINPELGGEEGFDRLHTALRRHGLGLLLDIVPNHMAASSHNPYWMETLEFGPGSAAARLFDIDWRPGKLLLPVLASALQATLEAGELALVADHDAGRLNVAYADRRFPLAPESAAALLAEAAHGAPGLAPVAAAWTRLHSGPAHPTLVEAARAALRGSAAADREALQAVLSAADLPAVLEAQHWRLAWWRTAADDLNYRRFFNITELIGVRVEDTEVFDRTHRLLLSLLNDGKLDGLRIDHIDGLLDPAVYLERLRREAGTDIPLFVEKILEPGEALPPWPVDGTTGYERLNDINGLFLDEAGWRALEADLRSRNLLVGTPAQRTVAAKRDILQTSFATELDMLVALARDGLDEAMRALDLTDTALRRGVVALLAHCPVYRTYATVYEHTNADLEVWNNIRAAVEQNEDPLTVAAASLLLDRLAAPQTASDRAFGLRFQQVSGPAMAKGFEDTELYRNVTLLSANEVGGSLEAPWRSPAELHVTFAARAERGIVDLTPLATHDTKRGPETRARLNALSQAPEVWLSYVDQADRLCAPLRMPEDGQARPDDTDLRLIHQTIYAAWPISAERLDAYLLKSLREAKRHTSWETPDEAYETASLDLARQLLDGAAAEPYRQALQDLLDRMEPAARILSLAQTILQLTLPGTPDLFQGTEFRDFSLVDPDNRRPVDWAARRAAMAGESGGIDAADAEKFALTRGLLRLRRRPTGFSAGAYRPLAVAHSPWRWFGFLREARHEALLVVVPTRIPPTLAETPSITFEVPPGSGWVHLGGERARLDTHVVLDTADPFLVLNREN